MQERVFCVSGYVGREIKNAIVGETFGLPRAINDLNFVRGQAHSHYPPPMRNPLFFLRASPCKTGKNVL
jgi:hypothetical protein